MKIVRLLSAACILSLLAACGQESITGPGSAEAPRPQHAASGNGALGSGN